MKPEPVVSALLLADQVFRQARPDGGPGKWCLVGVFDQIQSPAFPALHTSFGVYARIGNAEGSYDVAFEFVDPDGSTVAVLQARMEARDRVTRDGIGAQVRGLPLPKPGTYLVRVLFDGKVALGDYPVRVALSEPSA